ncbi:hypothetical protein ACFQZO_28115 [Bradyrhizobium sp. GCM10027634]|uniref:hypothetical protein n=1 Tax=unclassified Bradyrhizobium TaxID=2631580 RepID=UPI00188BD961|nr:MULTISPECIES: hypothetical protein [unclassified Bradyrhizobium]MDN5004722.1 hypothetical protein [Bradyrhizobium sp. WYCCWR 12677]QOZ45336.1 hypothetical protein XH89_19015 [Bradyrhizobium sp. CCBAU 53340]
MTRFAAALLLSLCVAGAGWAQDSEPADRCFPWQEFRNGICAAKSAPMTPAPIPAAPGPSPPPAPAETNVTASPFVCPLNTHVEGGACIADVALAPALPRAPITITCNGGMARDGQCACPVGFRLMASGTDPGGTCVRVNADNCLGGQMTVSGECPCNGQVTMSGQVYDLEFARGKCVPKRCPRDAPCATPAAKPDAPGPKLSSVEQWHDCGHGMVTTRHGCAPARHRAHAADPGTYFRMAPNYLSPMTY